MGKIDIGPKQQGVVTVPPIISTASILSINYYSHLPASLDTMLSNNMNGFYNNNTQEQDRFLYNNGFRPNNKQMPMNNNKINKMGLQMQPDSLFSMAFYDFDQVAQQEAPPAQAPAFHPVDEYKDLSLKEILDLSDDFAFGDEDPAPATMNPIPLNAPSNVSAQQVPPMVAPRPMQSQMYEPMSHQEQMFSQEVVVANNKKRSREISDDDESEEGGRRFRPYQAGQWAEKFQELCEYRDSNGHCLVPHTYKENLPLARWVKRQRYQYKLMIEGKSSTMTPDRVHALENIGFVWDSQGAAWGDRLNELREFALTYKHCNVPSNFSENPQLATWVKCQRRQYKLYMEGKPSNMTPQRIRHLEVLGFEWELRTYKKTRIC